MTINKDNKKNMILHLLEYKRAMRECIQKGGNSKDLEKVAKAHGFRLVTPLS